MVIKRITRSDKDIATLARLQNVRQFTKYEQPEDYKNKVVIKPWGYEYLIFENEYVAIWFLHIKDGHSTSMHCHPQKKTCLMLLDGEALFNTLLHRNYLNGFGGIVIDKSVFHSTKAISKEGIHLIEIESPPDKLDLVRLNDSYGREMQSYEGFSEMQEVNLDRYSYFFFEESDEHSRSAEQFKGFELSIETYLDNVQFQRCFTIDENGLYVLAQGRILASNEEVLSVGNLLWGKILIQKGAPSLQISEKTVVLKAVPKISSS